MKHNKCGSNLVLDCSSMYLLRSPSIKVTVNGIFPGVIQVDSCKSKSSVKLMCSQCNDVFATKEDYEKEIVDSCFLCKKEFSPAELLVVEGLSYVCSDCMKKVSNPKANEESLNDNYIYYFGEIIKSKSYPTLLTILMKR